MGTFLRTFVELFILALEIALLGRVIVSWISPRFDNPISQFLYDTTEPILRPIRSVLPRTGMLDLSPFIAFLILGVVGTMIGRVG